METLVCPHCSTANTPGNNYCSKCGALLTEKKAADQLATRDLYPDPKIGKPEQLNQKTPEEILLLQKRMGLESRKKSGANWFYWIAGLSILNSIISLVGGGLHFLFGLGVTQITDAFAYAFAQELPELGVVFLGIGFVISLIVAAVNVLFGFLANKGRRWIFILGMVLYALDSLVLLFFKDYISFAFHLFVLFGLYNGFKASGDILKLQDQLAHA
ncbi:MAG: hypothetical protein EHM70_12245 [Chloroflexota bacterium]|nr:MAG: hypothetical protein EHM70_12245 [Chloroflexota bacterium]